MDCILVNSLEHFTELCNINGKAEFFILLSGGLTRSAKQIHYDNTSNKYDVYNEIDDTWQENLSESQLCTDTIIPEAIKKSALYFNGVQFYGII